MQFHPEDDRQRRWKFGQNFLVDETVVRDIVDDAGSGPGDWVLEIGPGQGALTRRLVAQAKKVTAIEIDPKWIEHLQKREWTNFEVIQADATRVDVEEILAKHAPIGADGKPIKPIVVGNLPYNRAAPILFRFLPHIALFKSMQIMVQYEVAKRICAAPHTRDFGFLSVFIQNLAYPELLRKISQDAFRPRPKVLSATVRLTPLVSQRVTSPEFLRFVDLAFNQKRKKVSNSLLPFYPKEKVEAALTEAGVRTDARAEDLSVDEFALIFETLGPPARGARHGSGPDDREAGAADREAGADGEDAAADLPE
jgi:16S rRNA (adenine1518-N6/adenine1519-N6)-dimethyltransferase